MPLQISAPPGETVPRIQAAVQAAIPGAQVDVVAKGNHFELRVVSPAFAGKRTLDRQRMVLSSLRELMSGDHAPVHAIDKLETIVP
jgi:acid stress-induced BolA-like protein IbaG/YrbA